MKKLPVLSAFFFLVVWGLSFCKKENIPRQNDETTAASEPTQNLRTAPPTFNLEVVLCISATTVGNKVYFAGGHTGYNSSQTSKTVDIYDAATNSWSRTTLEEARTNITSIAAGNKIFWAGGIKSYSTPISYSNQVEIKDLNTGTSTSACMLPRSLTTAVAANNYLVFFTGFVQSNDSRNGTHFEIYDTTTDTWLNGVLNQKVYSAAVISVNNTIYVAGGVDNSTGSYLNQVWKMEF